MSIWIKGTSLAVFFLLIFALAQDTTAQTYQTMSLTSENGLPSNQVNCMVTDPLGFLWLGTNAGLARWDQNLTTYNTSQGLIDNEVTALATDVNNRLWIGTKRNGLFYLGNNSIQAAPSNNNIINKSITALYYSTAHQLLFIGTTSGLSTYDGALFSNHNGSLSSWQITSFLENDTSVWFCTSRQGMYYYHFANKKVNPLQSPFWELSANTIFRDTNGEILIPTGYHGFKKITSKTVKEFQLDLQVTEICKDKWGSIWIAGHSTQDQQSRLYLFKNDKLIDFTHRLQLPDKKITCLFADHNEGVLLTAIQNGGIIACPGTAFQNFNIQPSQYQHLHDITEDRQQNIWIASNQLLKIGIDNDDTREGLNLSEDAVNIGNAAPTYKIAQVERSLTDILYLQNRVIYKINSSNNKPSKVIDTPDDPIELFSCHKSLLLTKSSHNINLYEFPSFNKLSSIRFPDKISAIHTGNKFSWILTTEGYLYKLDHANYKITSVNNKNELLPTNLAFIEVDINQNLICADNYGNIYLTKGNNLEIIEKWSLKTHFPGSTIHWLLCDSRNSLWIGTDKGLSRIQLNDVYQKKRGFIRNWGKGEGYYCPSAFKAIETSNGQIWVLSENKVTRFTPNDIETLERQPHLLMTHIKSTKTLHSGMSQRLISRVSDNKMELSFSSDENSIMFWFDITNTLNKERVLYQYRLLPGNVEWSAPSRQPFVFLSDLTPGNYTLAVQASFEHAPHNIAINEYIFTVRSPWYLSLYAQIIYIIIFIMVLAIFIDIKIKQVRKQEEIKTQTSERMALLKMEALQAQMNPHFIFNALNTLQYSILENNTETSLEFISEFSKLIRSTLDNASQHFISIQNEIDYIENYMKVEQMRYINSFYYSLTVAEDIDTQQIFVPPMLLQPHIENAIKYAFTTSIGYIIISFSKIQDKLICMIEDNGIGRQQSMTRKKSHQSRSHLISKERFEMLNQLYKRKNEYKFEIEDLVDENNNPTGTRVTLIYPLINAEQAQIVEVEVTTPTLNITKET
jgi:ligand-binding sensor domain-containing protein